MRTTVLENEIHRILRAFEIQTDHLIWARRPDQVIIHRKMRTGWIVDFAILADLKVKLKEREKICMDKDLA